MKVTNCGKRFVAAIAVAAAAVAVPLCTGCGTKQPTEKPAAKTAAGRTAGTAVAPVEKSEAQEASQAAVPKKQSMAATAAAQQPGAATLLRLPLATRGALYLLPFQVVGPAPHKSLQITLSESAQNFWRRMSGQFRRGVQDRDGHSVALIGAPESEVVKLMMGFVDGSLKAQQVEQMKLAHVQVVELDEQGHGLIRLGAAAAGEIRSGDTIFLLRPRPELKTAPDLLPLADGRSTRQAKPNPTQIAMRTSINNLKQIGLAMHNFANAHFCFPPAVVSGPDGKAWHSWRVLLLPYLGQTKLYDQYRFDEPWDGPHNKRLIEKVPLVYCDPIHGPNQEGYTHYAVAVGRGTAFPPEGYKLPANPPPTFSLPEGRAGRRTRVPGTTSFADFRDGTSNSLLVGPVSPERKIPWTKPEDVVFDEHFPGLGKPGGFSAPYKTDQGAGGIFGYADGFVRTIRDDVDVQVLRSLLLIADGREVQNLPSIPTPPPAGKPTALPVLELKLGGPEPSARLVLEPIAGASGPRGRGTTHPSAAPPVSSPRPPAGKAAEWTCSMHPQIRVSRPGKCPICGMDLIPRASQGASKPPEGGNKGGARPTGTPMP